MADDSTALEARLTRLAADLAAEKAAIRRHRERSRVVATEIAHVLAQLRAIANQRGVEGDSLHGQAHS